MVDQQKINEQNNKVDQLLKENEDLKTTVLNAQLAKGIQKSIQDHQDYEEKINKLEAQLDSQKELIAEHNKKLDEKQKLADEIEVSRMVDQQKINEQNNKVDQLLKENEDLKTTVLNAQQANQKSIQDHQDYEMKIIKLEEQLAIILIKLKTK